jgi:DNA polymerase III delta subunit
MIYFLYGEDSFRSKEKLNEIILSYRQVHKSGLNLVYFDADKNFDASIVADDDGWKS